MALGWDGLGDLNQYQSREEITKKLQEIEKTDTSKKNDTTANYEFFKIMKVGDIVIAKKGIKEFIGYGVVTSDYYYDPERENYRSCRKVNWIKKGTWLEEKGGIVVKTLTDITTYPTYPKRLGELLGFNVSGNVLMADNNHIPLNTIMFGPPGTGKTYHTVGEAMKIVDPEFYKANKDFTLRKVLRQRYQELLIKDWEATTGQIGFCTFHQSFSYEDFVEGIRPKEPQEGDTYLKYEVEEGIFKRICRLAEDNLKSLSQKAKHLISIPSSEFASASFYKISLGDINDPADQEIYDYCVENGLISIGFGDGIDFKGKDESGVNEAYTEKYRDNGYGAQAINFFKNYLKVGNYVVVSKGNFYVRAIGKVIGEYFYDPKTTIRHKHFRKVDWLFKDQEIPIQDIYEKNLSQQTIYKLKSDWIKREFFVKSSESSLSENNNDPKKFVVIIDEINRGNVASIFGELITLIERDKRAGKEEATEVVLPYSKEKFSVPANLYIIGTMNTADRSIEALDTALRRRFSFREMPPKPELIKTEGALKETEGRIGTIDVVELLETINKRLEKLIDKDHRIGHSYFMHIKTEAELKVAFKDKVIPLLEEYFFGDFGKIGLVLGNSFVEKVKENAVFAKFEDYGSGSQDLAERPVYRIKGEDEWNFSSIYE
jgi:predicted Mrr-cat superfamily restriction endonuclease